MARWLCIDPGTKRMGIAVGDSHDRIATPLKVVPAHPAAEMFRQVRLLAEEYGAQGVVVGWPLNMDGTEGDQGKLARQAALELQQALGLDVRLWDERLSSFTADQALAGLLTRGKKKEFQDAVAAAAILQDFFAGDGPAKAVKPADVPAKP